MKILHFIYDHINNPWVGGGGAVRAYEIYKRLAQKGHETTVVSGNYPGAKDYKEGNLTYKFAGSDKNYIISVFSYAYKAIQFLKKYCRYYDIIIEDFAPWNPLFSYKIQKKKTVILQIQNFLGKEILKKYKALGLPFYFIEKFYPFKFKNIIVVSEALNKRWNINGKVISNGIECFSNESKIGSYLAFLGRIDITQKGLDLIVNVAKLFREFEFKIAGDGKDRARLINMIKDIPNIKYIGKVSGVEKYTFISNSKFLIMPSRFEGQGIVALEALAMGKPLIVSDIAELKYVMENGFGISFRSQNANSLRNAIEFLLKNENLIFEMGQKARQYATQFTWDRIADDYEKYLIKILK